MIVLDNYIPPAKIGIRGRLAPSPTGFLHLGNAWAFWLAWLSARSLGGECVLRLEDIDPARSRPEYAEALVRDLAWLGLDWDYGPGGTRGGGSPGMFRQSERTDVYRKALCFLRDKGLVYPCYCTRKELRSIAGAPHMDDMGASYPGTCRNLPEETKKRYEAAKRGCSMRLFCPEDACWVFDDMVLGEQRMTLAGCGGDFALRRSDGVFAYQLAVVVDDIAMGVSHVVRGEDILTSTPRQLYLYSLLGAQPPRYAHVPLVTDDSGERLAKRHASLTLGALREAGVLPQTILGWFAMASGVRPHFAPMRADEGIMGFSFAAVQAGMLRLPPDPVAYFLTTQRK